MKVSHTFWRKSAISAVGKILFARRLKACYAFCAHGLTPLALLQPLSNRLTVNIIGLRVLFYGNLYANFGGIFVCPSVHLLYQLTSQLSSTHTDTVYIHLHGSLLRRTISDSFVLHTGSIVQRFICLYLYKCSGVWMCVWHCWNAIRVSEIFCIVTLLENVVVVIAAVEEIMGEWTLHSGLCLNKNSANFLVY